MGIKRPLMILGSTVGAVATVLSYHPAASGTAASLAPAPDLVETTPTPDATISAPAATPTATPTETSSAAPTPMSASTPQATTKKSNSKKTQTSSASASSANATTDSSKTSAPGASASATPTPEATTSAPAATPATSPAPKGAKDQTVVGATAQTRWGPVQVQITVKDGKIVNAVSLQYPNGDRRSQWISDQAIPWLVEETLAEQIADVQIIGGATYTSKGWRQSLASAMQKAGL